MLFCLGSVSNHITHCLYRSVQLCSLSDPQHHNCIFQHPSSVPGPPSGNAPMLIAPMPPRQSLQHPHANHSNIPTPITPTPPRQSLQHPHANDVNPHPGSILHIVTACRGQGAHIRKLASCHLEESQHCCLATSRLLSDVSKVTVPG